MWLTRGTPGSAPGCRGCCPSVRRTSPDDSHQGCHAEVLSHCVLLPENFPGHATGTERRALSCSSPEITLKVARWWYSREFLKKPPAHARYVRGRPNEEDSVAELLSEHCLAGKCSTSHLAAPRSLWSGCGWPAPAPSRSGHQAPMTHQACHLGSAFGDRSGSTEFSQTRHWYRKLRLNLLQPAKLTKSGRLVIFSRKPQKTCRP